MDRIAIGTAAHFDEIRERLHMELPRLSGDLLSVRLEESRRGSYRFVALLVNPAGESREAACGQALRATLAELLTDLVYHQVELALLHRLLRARYGTFSPDDARRICTDASRLLSQDPEGTPDPNVRKMHRQHMLAGLIECLSDMNELVLEGFVRFRCKEYVKALEHALDRAVEQFSLDQDYEEFIHLLQGFVEMQEPQVDEVHVVTRSGGRFRILDADGATVDNEYLEGFLSGFVQTDVDHEDLLVSALITLVPRQIVLHLEWSRRVVTTIQRVFGTRVTVCAGCERCSAIYQLIPTPGGPGLDGRPGQRS